MISIVTPVYNGEAHIGSTLDSLSQQRVAFEHIVMDALSKDRTRTIAESYADRYNVRVISEKDEGLYDAVQRGFGHAKGDILGWLNAGDFYLPWTLLIVEKIFELYPEVEWITGLPTTYYEQTGLPGMDVVAPIYSQRFIKKGWHNGYLLPHIQQESTFWRRSLWERSKGADVLRGNGHKSGFASDYHLWKRFAEHAPLRTACMILAVFSISPGQFSERLRTEYARDCGLSKYHEKPNRLTWQLFKILSMCRFVLQSRAVSGKKTIAGDFPVRIL